MEHHETTNHQPLYCTKHHSSNPPITWDLTKFVSGHRFPPRTAPHMTERAGRPRWGARAKGDEGSQEEGLQAEDGAEGDGIFRDWTVFLLFFFYFF